MHASAIRFYPPPSLAGFAAWKNAASDFFEQLFLMHMDLWPWAGSASGPAPARGQWDDSGRNDDPLPPSGAALEYHDPVLLNEALALLAPSEGKLMVDCTLGGGGHSEALLRHGANVMALDQDPAALAHARHRLRCFAGQFTALQGNFRQVGDMLSEAGIQGVDGILADLGCSSRQLDDPSRGFSFQAEGPLDMRMNPTAALTAADIVNGEAQEELERIFTEYGEEPQARRIARGLADRRKQHPFRTTTDLANFIQELIGRHGKRHPGTRVFQALRIAVNDELAALQDFLVQAPKLLKPGGRLVVISFHSLEDRLVKHAFQRYSAATLDRPEWPAARPNPELCLKVLTRKPVEPSDEEIKRNPRARSARLRAAERIKP